MAIQGITNQRINDIGGGMNTYLSPSSLATTECVLLQNGITEGSSIKSIPWTVFYDTPDLDDLMGKIDASAPSMVYSADMTTLCIVPFGDWVYQLITPTDSGAVGYNYLAIRAFNKRLNIDKTTITLIAISPLKTTKISWLSFKLTNTYLCIWWSGILNTPLYAFKLNESTGVITAWDAGITGVVLSTYPKTVCYDNARLIVGGDPNQPWVVYFSRPASATNPEYAFDFSWSWSGAKVVSTGWRISAIFRNNDKLFIGTDTEIYSGEFTASDTLSTTLFANSGILCHEAVCDVNQDTLYFDGFDVRRLSYEANILALKDSSISDKIRNTLRLLPEWSVAWQYKRDLVTTSFIFPLYKLYTRTTFADINDIAFVYNVIDKSWSVESVNVKSTCLISYNKHSLLTTNGSLDILEVKDVDWNDWDAKTFKYLSWEFVFGDDVDYKRFVQYEVFGEITDEVQATIYIYIDGNLKYQKDTTLKPLSTPTLGATTFGSSLFGSNSAQDTLSAFRERLDFFLEGRSIQVGIECTDISRIKIDGHNFQYKFIQAYPIH